MDFLRRLFSRSLSLQKPKSNGLPSSLLAKLPVDVLLYIVDYLPAESSVAFSLSCAQLKALIFTQSLSHLTSSSSSTLALLELLALDLPNEIACSACMRLHSMASLPRYSSTIFNQPNLVSLNQSSCIPACASRDRNQNTWIISHRLGATAFKMAVKRWNQDPECSEILKMMSSETIKTKEMKDYMWLSREECRIVQGNLMHRLQSVCILHKVLRAMPLNFGPYLPPEEICSHISISKNEHNIGAGVRRCQECRTEYRIDLGCYENNRLAIFFTRWKDLGTGPENKLWLQHLPSRRPSASLRSCFERQDRAQSSARANQRELWPLDGDISSAFGDGSSFKFDSILEEQ